MFTIIIIKNKDKINGFIDFNVLVLLRVNWSNINFLGIVIVIEIELLASHRLDIIKYINIIIVIQNIVGIMLKIWCVAGSNLEKISTSIKT